MSQIVDYAEAHPTPNSTYDIHALNETLNGIVVKTKTASEADYYGKYDKYQKCVLKAVEPYHSFYNIMVYCLIAVSIIIILVSLVCRELVLDRYLKNQMTYATWKKEAAFSYLMTFILSCLGALFVYYLFNADRGATPGAVQRYFSML